MDFEVFISPAIVREVRRGDAELAVARLARIREFDLPEPMPASEKLTMRLLEAAVNITELYNVWKNGTHPNVRVQLRPKLNGNNNFNEFYSADYPDDPAKRSKLIVTP